MLKSSSPLPDSGLNRTGIMTHPDLNRQLIEGACSIRPDLKGDGSAIQTRRAQWAQDCLPIGSPPLPLGKAPASKRGGSELLTAEAHSLLLDQLSGRLQFERMGARLYEALIAKREQFGDGAAADHGASLPELGELHRIRDDELRHYALIQRLIIQLDGDPTVVSPTADTVAVMGQGLVQILTDPRTGISHCLQAMLAAELQDNVGWQLLIDLVHDVGLDELIPDLEVALQEENAHLDNVRDWLSTLLSPE